MASANHHFTLINVFSRQRYGAFPISNSHCLPILLTNSGTDPHPPGSSVGIVSPKIRTVTVLDLDWDLLVDWETLFFINAFKLWHSLLAGPYFFKMECLTIFFGPVLLFCCLGLAWRPGFHRSQRSGRTAFGWILDFGGPRRLPARRSLGPVTELGCLQNLSARAICVQCAKGRCCAFWHFRPVSVFVLRAVFNQVHVVLKHLVDQT